MACLQLLVVVDEPLHGGVQLGQLAAHVVVACDQSLHLRASLLFCQLGKITILTKVKNVKLYLLLAVVQLLFQGRELLRLNFPEMLFALCTMMMTMSNLSAAARDLLLCKVDAAVLKLLADRIWIYSGL